ncbi:MAG: DUF4340 domain-containing protein [Phaeodactylibacter sp.]|nr:DUF4340 domain-containing protein [Phaeodactylibacter sp.]MCB9304190.1 DUF4340 domain-containing protein [Lewinellaceae bacterium]
MNNKVLLLILAALLAIYGLSRLFSGKKDSTFQTELISVDSTVVGSLQLAPKGEEAPFSLKKEEGRWFATQNDLTVPANASSVQSLLAGLSMIRTQYIAAKDKEKWPEYEVEEGKASHVQVYDQKGKLLKDFFIGRFDVNQQARTITAFIRLNGQNEVYAVDGMQTMAFGRAFLDFRNTELLKMTREMEVTAFDYVLPDTTLQFQKSPTGWQIGSEVLDSMKVEDYLNVLRNVSGDSFADDFDELKAGQYPQQQLILKGNNILEPFEVTVYRDTTRELPFVIRSNYNPNTYFASDSTGLFKKLFVPVEGLQ